MKTKRLFNLMIPIVVFALLATACGGGGPALPKLDIPGTYAKLDAYGMVQVQLDVNATNLFVSWARADSDFRLGLNEQIGNAAFCYKNVAATESEIAAAVMAQSDLNKGGLINALVTASVSGEQATTKCAGLNDKLADWIMANRAALHDAYVAAYEASTADSQHLSDHREVVWLNQMMAGGVAWADICAQLPSVLKVTCGTTYHALIFPTLNLKYTVPGGHDLCNYYLSGDYKANLLPEVKQLFADNQNGLDDYYAVQWSPVAYGGKGSCTLYRRAALDKMQEPVLSGQTQDVVNSGNDQSAFPTDVPVTPKP